MRLKKLIFPVIVLLVIAAVYCTPQASTGSRMADIKAMLIRQQEALDQSLGQLEEAAGKGDTLLLRTRFLRTRELFKNLEWFCEYYAPGVSREVNGPPLPEVEVEETKSFEPSGLQVIEELIYPFQPAERESLKHQVISLRSSIKRFKIILRDTEMTEARIFDACKLEIFRIVTTGITGFDTPLSYAGVAESATSLAAVKNVLGFFGTNAALEAHFDQAVLFVQQHPDFNNFNRMEFIRDHANIITKEIVRWQKELNIKPLDVEQALHRDAATLFDREVFNLSHFVNSTEAMPSPGKLALGKSLFNDPMVSGSARTCQSCHKPELAFTDGLTKSESLTRGKFVKRNAPSLYYAGLQNAQFYDMRFQTLENQAMDVIANKEEMHGSVEDAAKRLQKDSTYYPLFKKAFPAMETEIKPRFVMIALASYIRSLNPFNSRFDKYMRGDDQQMNQGEIAGFNLFTGKAKCATCHFMPLFNGTAGPIFANTEAEVLGTLEKPGAKRPVIDPDEGRYFWNKMDMLKFAFKTPTLRNVAVTAPYMHNGAYKTLEQVMDFYNKGGASGLGIPLENQTLSAEPLNLSDKEITEIISFMKTLTDR